MQVAATVAYYAPTVASAYYNYKLVSSLVSIPVSIAKGVYYVGSTTVSAAATVASATAGAVTYVIGSSENDEEAVVDNDDFEEVLMNNHAKVIEK